MNTLTRVVVLFVGLAMLPGLSASGQQRDARWAPWIGCWQVVADEDTPATDDMLCVRPAAGGVEVLEVTERRNRSVQTLVADGQPRDVTAEGCTGWRSVVFSLDGRRLFTHAEQACEREQVRASTGLIAMVSPREWIDVQATDLDGRSLGWVSRYRPARAEQVEAAGFPELVVGSGVPSRAARIAAAAPDVDDIIEASQTVDPEAVRAWVAELGDPFDLDARRLLRLADGGVPESVIDVMVAVSYPDRFAVLRNGNIEELESDVPQRGYGRRTIVMGTSRRYRDPFYYSPFGYGYGYGDPYGYGYGYPNGGYYQPGVVIVVPRSEVEPEARVVRGRGYTRNRGGSSNSGPPSAPQRRNGQPSAGGSSDSSRPSSAGPSSGGSRSGSSTGRTAKPRER